VIFITERRIIRGHRWSGVCR